MKTSVNTSQLVTICGHLINCFWVLISLLPVVLDYTYQFLIIQE